MSKSLCDMTLNEIENMVAELNEPKFRAKQIYEWLRKGIDIDDMTNIPKTLREKLAHLDNNKAKIYEKRISQKDGTCKYLFELDDGNMVEGVLMHYKYGNTLCLSTQVGCNMGCAFCASTLNGCIRNLTASEMVSEVMAAENDCPREKNKKRSITNLVLMGSGEPLDNYDNVVEFLKRITAPDGINISPRNISISTCGLVPKVRKFISDAPHVTLSVSLHAPNNEIRDKIMPINKVYKIEQLLEVANEYAEVTGRRVIFEYALIKNLNSSKEHSIELSKRLRGINCHVNLIPLNSVKERNLEGVTRKDAELFAAWLAENKISATVRREMGADIDGACGQLRRKVLEERAKANDLR